MNHSPENPKVIAKFNIPVQNKDDAIAVLIEENAKLRREILRKNEHIEFLVNSITEMK